VLINLLVDLLMPLFDPRLKTDRRCGMSLVDYATAARRRPAVGRCVCSRGCGWPGR
jgi:hypothetical protein